MGDAPPLATLRLSGAVLALLARGDLLPGWPDEVNPHRATGYLARTLSRWYCDARRTQIGHGEIWVGQAGASAVAAVLTHLEMLAATWTAPGVSRACRDEGRTVAHALGRAELTLRREGWIVTLDGRGYRITWAGPQ